MFPLILVSRCQHGQGIGQKRTQIAGENRSVKLLKLFELKSLIQRREFLVNKFVNLYQLKINILKVFLLKFIR